MNPIKSFLGICLFLVLLFDTNLSAKESKVSSTKTALMWFDAEANFERFSHKDSIAYYLKKIKLLGFTHAIVDVRPITGEVLFDSKYAPKMKEWNGTKRSDFDYLGEFMSYADIQYHALLNELVQQAQETN